MGTRLRPYTLLLPNPMLPVVPKPIMQHKIEWLKSHGITNIVVSTGYLGRMIRQFFDDGSELGVNIEYVTSRDPLGTGGQLKAAETKLGEEFLCVYGDALLKFDLGKLLEFHKKHKALATMALMKYETELKYGFMETDRNGRLLEWKEKPKITGYINVGCYAMKKRFLDYMPAEKMFGMNNAFERAMSAGERLCGFK